MKTQISKNSYRKDKRYSGVYQQQGRMLTDADWNETVDILKGELADALQDIVGNGSPRVGAVTLTDDRKIKPGDLYVDGLHARLPGREKIGADEQPDLPGYTPLPAIGPYVIYADVWERTVTCLEDGDLRDPGLHGADTCTRRQTMLQVKWRPEPVERGLLPRQGNGLLSLELHANLEAGDPCDPCAGMVTSDTGRVGNYLFRLEVHEVQGAANNPDEITLKWSSENGAEQFEVMAVDRMPPGFISEKYVYEFFSETSEKHLGVHLATGFTPVAGIIRKSYDIPAGQNEPNQFVRRWDGFCVLHRSGTTWSLTSGRDKGVDLSLDVAPTAHGHVSLDNDFTVNLKALKLTLVLRSHRISPGHTSERTFVGGDYWSAPVRETIHQAGSAIVTGIQPEGIVHHYLQLVRVKNDGTVERFHDDADRRRNSFPPLTDIRARDVGYTADCTSGLFSSSHDNVKKALDQVCNIQAQNVGFTKPCDTSLFQGNPVATVQDALALLCDIKAQQISFTAQPDCSLLNQPGINTVQDAINTLCRRPAGSGCMVTVGVGGQYSTLKEAFSALQQNQDICICLLPGDHVINEDLSVTGKNAIKISGCGVGSVIQQGGEQFLLNANQIILRDTGLLVNHKTGGIILKGNQLIVEGSTFVRTVGQENSPPLVRIREGTVRWHNNRMRAWWTETVPQKAADYLLPTTGGLLPADTRHHLQELTKINPYESPERFSESVEQVAVEIKSIPDRHRARWFSKRPTEKIHALAKKPRAAIEGFYSALTTTEISRQEIGKHLEAAVKTFFIFHSSDALALEPGVGGWLEDNIINGSVALHYGGKYRSLNWGRTNAEQQANIQNWADHNQYITVDPVTLRLRGNDFQVVSANGYSIMQIIEAIINTGESPFELQEQGYKSMEVTGNIFHANNNSFVCESLVMNGNQFPGANTGSQVAAFVLGAAAVFTGNVAPHPAALIETMLKSGWTREAANLLEIV